MTNIVETFGRILSGQIQYDLLASGVLHEEFGHIVYVVVDNDPGRLSIIVLVDFVESQKLRVLTGGCHFEAPKMSGFTESSIMGYSSKIHVRNMVINQQKKLAYKIA